MRFYLLATPILAAAVCCGCDTAPETVTPVNRDPAVDINVDANDAPADDQAEGPENLLDAIDNVDVDVSDGRVDVDVE